MEEQLDRTNSIGFEVDCDGSARVEMARMSKRITSFAILLDAWMCSTD